MRNAFLGIFLMVTLLSIHLKVAYADPPLVGEMSKFNFSAPQQEFSELSLSDDKDEQVSFNQFRGKIVLLNVWATWCGPCVRELPGLDKLQADVGTSDFVVVPVSIDRGGAHQAMPFLRRMNIQTVTPYFDKSNSIGRMLVANRIPITIIIGRDGQEIGRLVGTTDWEKPEARELINYFIQNGGEEAREKYGKAPQVATR